MQHPARFAAVNSESDTKMHLSAKGSDGIDPETIL